MRCSAGRTAAARASRRSQLLALLISLLLVAPVRADVETDAARYLTEGRQLFKKRDYAAAAAKFDAAATLDEHETWATLYGRMSRYRLQELEGFRKPPEPFVVRPALPSVPMPPPVTTSATQALPAAGAGPSDQPAATPVPPSPPVFPQRPEAEPAAITIPAPPTGGPPPLIPPPPLSGGQTFGSPEGAVLVNGDIVEFFPDAQRVVGVGHIDVTSGDSRMRCDRVTVFLETKDAFAEGNVRIWSTEGVLRGERVYYNFETGKGSILNGWAAAPPVFVGGGELTKVGNHALYVKDGYVSTSPFDPPPWRIQARETQVFLDDKVVFKHAWFLIGETPIFYFPRFTHSLRDNQMKVRVIPGKEKAWGVYALTTWRYELNANAKGNVHVDWREMHGWGEGLDYQYKTADLGEGILMTYYNQHRDRRIEPLFGAPTDRYRILWRHRWDIDPETILLTDFQKFRDLDFRRDFLFREEFVKETTPLTYALLTQTKPTHTLSALLRKRVNRFDTVSERLPEIKLDVKEQRIGETNLFYKGELNGGNYTNKNAAGGGAPNAGQDDDVNRIDLFNQLSYALRFFKFLNVTPRAGIRETYYSKDIQGSSREGQRHFIRSLFTTGVEASTKVFRVFELETNWLGLDLHRLRHVITPTVNYAYTHRPTVPSSLLQQFDSIDNLTGSNQVVFGLENKLQTKRRGAGGHLSNVDLARLIIEFPYVFKPEGGISHWSSIVPDLELSPYSWLRIETDATYDTSRDGLTLWNADTSVSWGDRLAVGLGHRYQRDVRTEDTFEVNYKFNERWRLELFGRLDVKDVATTGTKRINFLREHRWTITRDLHDWIAELTVQADRDLGDAVFFTLRLKAFPGMPLELEDNYNRPKEGSQTSPFYQGTPFYQL